MVGTSLPRPLVQLGAVVFFDLIHHLRVHALALYTRRWALGEKIIRTAQQKKTFENT